MKFAIYRKFIPALFVFSLMLIGFGCNGSENKTNVKGTPTEAYKKLYEAVKSKNTDAIKAVMTKSTVAFAQAHAQRTNQTLEKVLENGFTATTFAASLPEIRDERVKDNMGAVEVYNSKESKWEDLPFVAEDGEWKLAIGDLFANTYRLPGKGRATLEMEAANAAGNNMIIVNTNGMGNFTSGQRAPKSDLPLNSATNTAPAASNKAK